MPYKQTTNGLFKTKAIPVEEELHMTGWKRKFIP